MTNFDKITKDVDRLALLMADVIGDCSYCPADCSGTNSLNCKRKLISWLQQEAKEVTE